MGNARVRKRIPIGRGVGQLPPYRQMGARLARQGQMGKIFLSHLFVVFKASVEPRLARI